ncbi:MAG: hypothetical protein AB1798_00745 [Spirochaetota bacterium]
MRGSIITISILLFMCLTSIPGLAQASQDFGWAVPRDGAFFPIGWTKDGTLFAYGVFGYSTMISNHSYIRIAVQNLITDQIVWDYREDWDEGNLGGNGGNDSPPPPTMVYESGEAWEMVRGSVEEHLYRFKIETGGIAIPARFPLQNGDELSVELVELKKGEYEVSYAVRAVSKNLGVKTIFNGVAFEMSDLSLLGYFPNPQVSRLAVILQQANYISTFPFDYIVIGCHLKAGFEKTR